MDAETMFVRGKDAADRGNYGYAIEVFLDLLKEFPSHLNARIALRMCELERFREKGAGFGAKVSGFFKGFQHFLLAYLFGGSPQRAIHHCERFLVNYPVHVPILIKLAHACQRMGHLDAAVNTLDFARQQMPTNIRVLQELGEMYHQKGDNRRAVRSYEEYLRIKPTDQDALRRLKDISAEGHVKDKLEPAKTARDTLRDVDQAKKLEKEQRIVRSADDVEEAIADLQAKLKEEPENETALVRLGDLYQREERFDFAMNCYDKAYAIGNRYQVREKIGDLKLRLLRNQEDAAKRAAAERPDDAEARDKAKAARQARVDFGIEEYEYRVKQHPTDVGLAMQLGICLFDKDEPAAIQRAITQFQRAVVDPKHRMRGHYLLGRCFATNERTRDIAIEELMKAQKELTSAQSDLAKDITYSIADLYDREGKYAESLDWYKKLVAVDASYRNVMDKIGELSDKLKAT